MNKAIELPIKLREDIGTFKTSSDLGELTLNEYVVKAPVDGIIILQNGEVVYEKYPRMYWHDRQWVASITKTFVATSISILEDKNLIDSSRPIDYYLEELKETEWQGTSKKLIRYINWNGYRRCICRWI